MDLMEGQLKFLALDWLVPDFSTIYRCRKPLQRPFRIVGRMTYRNCRWKARMSKHRAKGKVKKRI